MVKKVQPAKVRQTITINTKILDNFFCIKISPSNYAFYYKRLAQKKQLFYVNFAKIDQPARNICL